MVLKTQRCQTQPIIFFCETDVIKELDKLVANNEVKSLDEPKLNRSKLIRKAVKKFIEQERKNGRR